MGIGIQPTKMKVVWALLSLLVLLATAEAYVSQGVCSGSDLGTETVDESWDCDASGGSACSQITKSCSCDGNFFESGGTTNYDSRGNVQTAIGGGWDCHSKCQGNPRSSGSQSKTSGKSCNGGGGSRGNGGIGSINSRNCDYSCTSSGGCKVTYIGPPRGGATSGSCFPQDFGGSCSGTPPECQDCNQAINC